ncbi:hypothetical protein HYV58_01745, partial [Candidatus Peregrinibacteria bacterium]|nr:hypothetical protein [Candidatus Peregrinibacteria bacterium]
TVTGEQELVSAAISAEAWNEWKTAEYGKKKLEDAFLKSSNKALKKAPEIAGGKMKGLWKEMGMENPAS